MGYRWGDQEGGHCKTPARRGWRLDGRGSRGGRGGLMLSVAKVELKKGMQVGGRASLGRRQGQLPA